MSGMSRRSMASLVAIGLAGASAPARVKASSPAPASLAAPLRARIADLIRRNQMPAVAVGAVLHGRPVLADALGFAALPFNVPATARTLFHWGSASKHLTAALVVRLALEGRLDLGDPIGRHVAGLPETLSSLPIHNLLSHTSGAPDYALLGGQPDLAPDRHIDRPTFLARIAALKPDFGPGQVWSYSNTGYVLLGYLVADVYGRPYRDVVTDLLLKPAGLEEGRMDDAPAVIAGRAEPYELDNGSFRHAVMMDAEFSAWPDGGLLMSARDAARWEVGLQSRRQVAAEAMRRITTADQLVTGRGVAYGFGWFLDRVHGREVHYHGGSVPGFLTFYIRVPALGLGVVAMTNVGSDGGGRGVQEIAQMVAEHLAPGCTWRSLEPIADDLPDLTAAARAILTRGKTPLDPDRYGPEIASVIGRPAGRRAGPPNLTGLGAMTGFNLVEAYRDPDGEIRRYRATYADQAVDVVFGYAADGRIFRARAL